MLFRKDIEKDCAYCANAGKIGEDKYLCSRKGIVCAGDRCRKFKYDPLKRRPAKAKATDFSQYDKVDFSL